MPGKIELRIISQGASLAATAQEFPCPHLKPPLDVATAPDEGINSAPPEFGGAAPLKRTDSACAAAAQGITSRR